MSMRDPQNQSGSILCHSEPLEVSPNQFLGWDFFCRLLQQTGSNKGKKSEPIQVYNEAWIILNNFDEPFK